MASRFTMTEDGEIVEVPMDESSTPKKGSQEKKEEKPKKTKRNHYEIAGDVCATWRDPLAWHGRDFWSFSTACGWVPCSEQLYSLAARLLGTAPDKTVLPILRNKLAIPSSGAIEAVYYQKEKNSWDSPWRAFPVNENEIVFSDQVYNIMTEEGEPHKGVIYGPLVSLPWAADGDEPRCEEFEELVQLCFPDKEIRDHFQESVSLLLQAHVNCRAQFIFWGVPHSRKTTLATALASCPAGRLGLSQIQERKLANDKFASSQLVNKFANISDDSAQSEAWKDFLKQYTSGSDNSEVKFENSKSVTPTAKLISTCNEIQNLSDATSACANRMLVFKFTRAFPVVYGSADDNKMTAAYWSHPSRRNGILSWLMEGLTRVRTRGYLNTLEIAQRWKKEAVKEADPTVRWMIEHLSVEEGSFTPSCDLTAACPVTDTKTLAKYIKRMFPTVASSTQRSGKQVLRGWKGLRLDD